MQQTSTYQLNLIEMDDVFSADPLNDNAEKLEAQFVQAAGDLAAEAKARADADAAEVKNRNAAIAVETKARTDAIAAEAKARADADTAETNARKSADTSEANTRAAADTALDTRVKALEARKFVIGTYTGNSTSNNVYQNINLGFQPKFILVYNSLRGIAIADPNNPCIPEYLAVTDTGFKVATTSVSQMFNAYTNVYIYLAIV